MRHFGMPRTRTSFGQAPRSLNKSRPQYELLITGPPGPTQRSLIETLREAGYTVSEPRPVGSSSYAVRVTVLAPHGETNTGGRDV